MTYVEGRFASRRAKTRALGALALALGVSFTAGVARNLSLQSPEFRSGAEVATASSVPEAVAYAGPLTDAPAPAPPRAARSRAAAPSDAVQAPALQADAAPAVESVAVDAVTIAPIEVPADGLSPPPSLATARKR
jgi:hypothetical protein